MLKLFPCAPNRCERRPVRFTIRSVVAREGGNMRQGLKVLCGCIVGNPRYAPNSSKSPWTYTGIGTKITVATIPNLVGVRTLRTHTISASEGYKQSLRQARGNSAATSPAFLLLPSFRTFSQSRRTNSSEAPRTCQGTRRYLHDSSTTSTSIVLAAICGLPKILYRIPRSVSLLGHGAVLYLPASIWSPSTLDSMHNPPLFLGGPASSPSNPYTSTTNFGHNIPPTAPYPQIGAHPHMQLHSHMNLDPLVHQYPQVRPDPTTPTPIAQHFRPQQSQTRFTQLPPGQRPGACYEISPCEEPYRIRLEQMHGGSVGNQHVQSVPTQGLRSVNDASPAIHRHLQFDLHGQMALSSFDRIQNCNVQRGLQLELEARAWCEQVTSNPAGPPQLNHLGEPSPWRHEPLPGVVGWWNVHVLDHPEDIKHAPEETLRHHHAHMNNVAKLLNEENPAAMKAWRRAGEGMFPELISALAAFPFELPEDLRVIFDSPESNETRKRKLENDHQGRVKRNRDD
ncbi:hypothetical protein K458DRAFT_410088 [Lentithecium fluviatile CBS 122367]|uniref:Uncharacterized protein n=1 Tax=Lentithecium fluviatile CBS 122367 TaxID=1168545 RepID=A0A6G1IG62_9PLEO|nr:hypothetical protein K458DRAFT_410088 [Lentithecium fluviatile CBS 122367]